MSDLSALTKDLRLNLNRAQDDGQEAMRNVERAIKTGLAHFDHEAFHFAAYAAHHARQFVRVHRALTSSFTNPDD